MPAVAVVPMTYYSAATIESHTIAIGYDAQPCHTNQTQVWSVVMLMCYPCMWSSSLESELVVKCFWLYPTKRSLSRHSAQEPNTLQLCNNSGMQ